MTRSSPSVLWFRRDLRRGDHPALLAAQDAAGPGAAVVPLFVFDPALWEAGGPVRRAWLAASLRALDEDLDGRLVLRLGDPAQVVPQVVREVEAASVHLSRETNGYGVRRDRRVRAALQDLRDRDGTGWVETGTPYAVGPGLVRTKQGEPYKVFTPFARAWREHGWPTPAPRSDRLDVLDLPSDDQARRLLDEALRLDGLPQLPPAGETAALRRWREFREQDLPAYRQDRDRPAIDGTSRLSAYLKIGALHPRTLLADLAEETGEGAQTFVTELAWREFYADVLHQQPASAWSDLRPALAQLRYDDPEDAVLAWQQGRTGYPMVDAGMRQLLAVGWMHNRVRMITASFLTKDLHVWWPVGARWFLDRLVDGDLASNNHGWQWVAGTGTDAAPYFRVFNPVTQGEKFDPDGDYVRRWVPELRHLPGASAHRPWDQEDGYSHDYPRRIVDHAEERREALERYEAAR
ncbi:cryptochrome/photolyase family protein [Ornithinimicrobium pratense]|uniref:Deoxyribodipyrimidine photo-lyase n=1 Tax=Ornithinimicrobium pratense TaxID=2593973 RepID=A0A5J6V2B4_9MICO|nr:deoxyribodipyrimidine photo-lyase [Ornithinimicrobium pratense]QFG67444.1 deoxyribodipyrimidine photo-lyase [Ornithinimicrobium pratense]